MLAEVKSLRETATAKLRRLVELQETITAAVQKRHYETAAKAVAECLDIDPDNAVAVQARRELDQLEAQAAAVVAELNAAMEGKHWRQARQQADAAAKDFPQFGYISEMRQKALAATAEEKQRVAKFVEGLADATRLLQERRLVSCRRQVDGLLQLQGQLDVVDDPDCAKTMPAARERLAALAGDLQAAEAEADELLALAREKLSQGEDEACLLLCRSVQDKNAEEVECARISAAAGEHFRALKGVKEQLRMANLYWVAGRWAEAEKAIKTVLAFQPEHAEATQLWQEVRHQRRQRRRRLAKMVLMSIVVALAAYALFVGYRFQHTRQQVKVHLAAARVAATQADWPAVMAAADKALALDEDNAEAKECRKAAQIGVMAEVLRERLATATEAKDRGDWDAALVTLGEELHREPFPGAFQVEPLKKLLTRHSALKKEVETGKWGAAVAAVAATLRERVSAAAAAQDRADWTTALVALTAERPQEPFAGAFAAEPLRGLLQQLATLEKDIRAGQRAAEIEALLSAARAAAAKQDWAAVLAAADQVLGLDANHAEAKKLRAEASRHQLRVPDGFCLAPGAGPEPYTNTGWAGAIIHEKSGIELVYIPAGTFTMGSPEGEEGRDSDEGPQHQVTLSQGFYLGKAEVTQAQWEKVTGKNPSSFQNAGAAAPVENVSWDDCQAFCQAAGSGLRLPLEAEWEYACRAGTTTAFHYGDSLDSSMANFDGNYPYGAGKKGEYRQTTIAVGQFKPNAWGLYDMIGNVWEWCQDKYETYPAGSVTLAQPAGPAGRGLDDGAGRVLRGGGWGNGARYCRSAYRVGDGRTTATGTTVSAWRAPRRQFSRSFPTGLLSYELRRAPGSELRSRRQARARRGESPRGSPGGGSPLAGADFTKKGRDVQSRTFTVTIHDNGVGTA